MSITVTDLCFSYSGHTRPTLQNLSARFDAGQITLLTGPSGCGKSTLLYLLAGIYPKNAGTLHSGTILIEGHCPAELPPPERCQIVGMMFQNPRLQFCMDTVLHELAFCLENRQVPPQDIPEQIDAALEFCQISDLKYRRLDTLSGGQQQLVMLACLVALNPRWLLLDEPFANVDGDTARQIIQKLLQLHEARGTGILAVDHQPELWANAAQQIICMEHGHLGRSYSPSQPLSPRPYREKPPSGAPGPVQLCLKNVSVRRGDHMVLQNLSMQFCQGRSYAIVGSSGCGKSTLFGTLLGLYPYEGRITLGGKSLRRRASGSMGFVTQSPQDQFLADTVLGELCATPHSKEQAMELLQELGLLPYRDSSAYLLSQGQQRRLGVAALMAFPCEVLVCDEPTYAQDRTNTIAIMDRLWNLVQEKGVTLIFSTHDLLLAESYANEILELKEGCLYAKS